MDNEVGRAAIWEIDLATGHHRVFASGIRNPNGMDWLPGSDTLWTTVNERDEIGSDLVARLHDQREGRRLLRLALLVLRAACRHAHPAAAAGPGEGRDTAGLCAGLATPRRWG